ncbi:MAG: hypothetical protein HY554_13890 [Elusimicrobia bacterium]|nr:hypothetical protein [Elusimicrobiota bacterium]
MLDDSRWRSDALALRQSLESGGRPPRPWEEPPPRPGKTRLQSIRVHKDQVVLEVTGPVRPTADFALSPPRLRLSLPGLDSALPPGRSGGDGRRIRGVTLTPVSVPEGLSIEILLAAPATYRMSLEAGRVRIRFNR